MSLICETIVSSDELSRDNNEEELDFEEEIGEEKDEGELDDDEDLEEGEVKDEEEDQRPKEVGNNRQNSICRFYGRGQCTWGNNCRFVHPTGGIIKRAPPPPPPPQAVVAINPQLMRRREFFQENSSTNESAWERGLKQAKEMIVRASRRKEEELDFEDKRFNLNSNEVNKSREYTEEYERRRRLAFESAPWNNEPRVKNPEVYRDPWRRSKSPLKRRLDSSSKRSHSMSSISASASDSTDFSGSEGSESFSSSGSNISGHSGGQRKRFNRKIEEKKKKSGINTPGNNWNKTSAEKSQENYDSWSESLSDSESISSYYSGSDSEEQQNHEKRIQKRPQKGDKKERSDGPPLKKVKTNQKIKSETQEQEAPKKSPIKMTFMKKKQSLKKEISSLAFNGKIEEEEEIIEESEEDKESSPPSVSPRTNNRREELLQQLRAVEDAIARKRSKIN